jgi:activator of HSP90 ATPase
MPLIAPDGFWGESWVRAIPLQSIILIILCADAGISEFVQHNGEFMNSDEKGGQTATRRDVIAGLTLGLSAAVGVPESASAQTTLGIARNMESIHHEVKFNASPERLYAALTDAKTFQKVVLLSGAVKNGMVKDPQQARISALAGGEFAVFGGYITGRQVELVSNVRIVQAWRTGTWDPGIYSIAKFALALQGTGTLLTFDHTGFPKGEADHLAEGWKSNYWEPLEKLLA